MTALSATSLASRVGEWAPRYYAVGETPAEIAQRLRCDVGSVLRALDEAGMALRPEDAPAARARGRG